MGPELPRSFLQLVSGRFGLSGRLLLLTVLFVMLAEVLIYVPSVANFRRNWLNDRLAAAQIAALVLDALYLKRAWQLLRSERAELPMRAFRFSINYLALLFAALLVDHYLPRAPF